MGIVVAETLDDTTWTDYINDVLANGDVSILATPTRIAGVTPSGLGYEATGTFTFTDGSVDATSIITSFRVVEDEVIQLVINFSSMTIEDFLAFDGTYLDESWAYSGAAADDFFMGGIFEDVLESFGGDDVLVGGGGNDIIDGGDGADTVNYGLEGGTQGVSVNLIQDFALDSLGGRDDLDNIENLTGTNADDGLFGNVANNILIGQDGDDSLNGRGGDDVIDGGAGADVIVGGTGDDDIDGGDGADVIGGRVGNDIIDGGAGDDTIVGQLGDDVIIGGAGADRLNGGAGFDDLSGGGGNDVILGRDDADMIFGGAGDDELNGGAGADRLRGDGGDDILIGGADGDTFVYETTDFGNDTMFRFAIGVDHIEISTAVAAGFDDLTIEQDGADAVITFGEGSVTLVNRDASLLSEDDFMFV